MRIKIDTARVAVNFGRVKDNASFQESAQLFARGLPVVEMLQAMAMNEGVLQAFAGFDRVYPHGSLERGILEKVILRVSQLHECQFCVNSHLDMMNSLGISVDLNDLDQQTEREQLAIQYAEWVTRDSSHVPDEFFERLSGLFCDSEIVELTFVIGLITMLNRFNNALGVRYSGELAGS
jgi:AhpD family alkylhydroperoxidase